ncbi:MAG: hypothetical protein HYY51_02025 [Candidatus Magasanikbacteria bacterium]|nr:hypothetical protein [Candidatus Magasanikbacteria bacterium]
MAALFRRRESVPEPHTEPAENDGGDFDADTKKWFAEFEGDNPYAKPGMMAKVAASDRADAEYRARMKAPEPKKMREPNRLAKFLGLGVLRNWEKEAAWLEEQEKMNRETAERIAAEHTVEQNLKRAGEEAEETQAALRQAQGKAGEGTPGALRLRVLSGEARQNKRALTFAARNARAELRMVRPVDPKSVPEKRIQELLDEAEDEDTLSYGQDGHMPFESSGQKPKAEDTQQANAENAEDPALETVKAELLAMFKAEENEGVHPEVLADDIVKSDFVLGDPEQALKALSDTISGLKKGLLKRGIRVSEEGTVLLDKGSTREKHREYEKHRKTVDWLQALILAKEKLEAKQDTDVAAGEDDDDQQENQNAESDNARTSDRKSEETEEGEGAEKTLTAEDLLAQIDMDGELVDVVHQLAKFDALDTSNTAGRHHVDDLIAELKIDLEDQGYEFDETGAIKLDDESNPVTGIKYKNPDDKGKIKLLQGLYEMRELESSSRKQNDAVGYGEGQEFPFDSSTPEEYIGKEADEDVKRLALRIKNMKKISNPHEGLKRRIAELQGELRDLKKGKKKKTDPEKPQATLHEQTDIARDGEDGNRPSELAPDLSVENAQGDHTEEDPKEIALRKVKAELLAMFKDGDNEGVHPEVLAGDILDSDFMLEDPKLALEAVSDSISGLKDGLLKRGIRVSDEGAVLLDKGSTREQNPKHEKHRKTIDWLQAFIKVKEKLERQLQNQNDKATAYGEDGEMPFESPKLSLDERIKRLTLRVETMKKITKKPHEGLKRRIAELEERLEALKMKKTKEKETQEPKSELAGRQKPRSTKKDDIRALGEEIQKLDIEELAERHRNPRRALVRQSGPKRGADGDKDTLKKAA